MITDLEVLEAARIGLKHKLAEVERLIAESGGAPAKRSKMSPEARAKIAAAQKKRWAKPQKRQMSAEGRERIAEATRKRWAEFRKAKGAKEKGKAATA